MTLPQSNGFINLAQIYLTLPVPRLYCISPLNRILIHDSANCPTATGYRCGSHPSTLLRTTTMSNYRPSLLSLSPDPITIEDYEYMATDMLGRCANCGADRDCCEPDARNYQCDECGEPTVYGPDEWLSHGLVE